MPTLNLARIVAMAISLIGGIAAIYAKGKIRLPAPEDERFKRVKKKRKWLMVLGVFLLWLFCGLVIGLYAAPAEGLHVEIMAPRMTVLGFDVSSSVVFSWVAMAVILVLAVLTRLFVIPKFREQPRGLQAVLELMVSAVSDYTEEKLGHRSEALSAYMLALAALMIGSAMVELFGVRPPTADLVMTFSLALCTFVMINYFGIKKKGVGGRLKSLAQPTPVIFPIRILTDIAIPVSLACRLFGNMLGGMIVMHLLYMALGAFSVGAPAVLGLYFNVFHPVIQVFIFMTLSLTFIGEAAE